MTNQASFAGFFSELFSLLHDARREVAMYTLAIGSLTAVSHWLGLAEPSASTLDFGFQIDSTDTSESALFEILAAIAGFVANYFLLKRLLAVRGRLHAEENRFWQYFGMTILSLIAVVLGFILVVIPGIFLLVRWSAASGYVVGEGQGISDSLTSSWNATKGHGWPIFFAGLVLFLGIIILAGLVGGVAGVIDGGIVNTVAAYVEAAASTVFVALGIAIYCLVHDDTEELSKVFA